jgi:hypothetical protein
LSQLSAAQKGLPNAQWKLDNINEIEVLLVDHVATLEVSGDQLRIRGPGGLEIILNPGDCLMRDGDRLGVVRVPDEDRQVKFQTIEVRCEQCNKPIEVDVDVLQDPATIWVVCSDECKEAYEMGLLLTSGADPDLNTKH